jgi:hypothetical protein
MVISRRKFIQAGSVLALAAGLPLKAAITATGQRTSDPPSASAKGIVGVSPEATARPTVFFSKATFTPYLNTAFVLQSKGMKAVEVKLVEIHNTGPVPDRQVYGRECFALVFRGQRRLSQDVYRVQHPALGKFDLLLVPMGKDKKGLFFEAIINRLN